MFCFPNTRQEILFPSNLVLFICISAHNQLRRKEKVSGSPRTSIGQTKHLGPRRAPPRPLRPVHTYPFFVWKRNFFSRFGISSTRIQWNASFQNALLRGDFWKRRLFVYVWTDTNRGFSNTMMPYIFCFQHEACSVRDAVVFSLFWRFRVDGRKRFGYATCGCVFFENGEKNLFSKISKISGYVWTGLRLRPDESAYGLKPHTYYFTRIGPQFTRNQAVNQLYTLLPKLKKSIYSTLVSSQNPSTLFLISQF